MADEDRAAFPAHSGLGIVSIPERDADGWHNAERGEKPTMDSRDPDGASTICTQEPPCGTPSTQRPDRIGIPAERLLLAERDQLANSDGDPWIP